MKEKLNLIILSIILGVGIWIIDIFAHSYMFSEGALLDILTHRSSDHQLFSHFFLLIVSIFFALLFLRLIDNHKKAVEIMKAKGTLYNEKRKTIPK